MRNEEKLTADLAALESGLSCLRPTGTGNRDELMFLAGRRAGRRGRSAWCAAAGVLAACLAVSLAFRPGPQVVERIVHVPVQAGAEAPPQPSLPAPDWTLASIVDAFRLPPAHARADFKLRQAVLERGVDALPRPRAGDGSMTNQEILEELQIHPRPARPSLLW